MNEDFLYTSINNDSRKVFRLGLSATYRPGRKAIYKAVDSGVNLFFLFGIDNQMISVTKDIMSINRDKYYICLLYTSPSPRDATLSRMPSSA